MSTPFSENQNTDRIIDLASLPLDLRRILSIQFREFIHHIEDAQPDNALERSPRVITFLERCFSDAA